MTTTTLPEGVFPSIRIDYDAHDKACISLPFMWFGRSGGVSCPGDLDDCSDCGVTFYNEGVAWLNWEAEDEDETRVCGCCAAKRGVTLQRVAHGITTA